MRSGAQRTSDGVGSGLILGGQHVGVGVHGHGDAGVAEPLGDRTSSLPTGRCARTEVNILTIIVTGAVVVSTIYLATDRKDRRTELHLLDPVAASEADGVGPYRHSLDTTRWPEFMLAGRSTARASLQQLAERPHTA